MRGLDHAASLSGAARADGVREARPGPDGRSTRRAVPYLIANDRFFTSTRVKNWIYSSYFGEPYFNALAVG